MVGTLTTDVEELVSEVVQSLEAKPPIAEILDRLGRSLSPAFTFHSLSHTRDVIRQAVIFGIHDALSERQLELLAIGAAYHDAGFLELKEDHEELGARMAEDDMRRCGGYSEEEIELVRTIIIDTKLIHTPSGLRQCARTELSQYLLDADLSNFGRDDFFERLEALCAEVGSKREIEIERTLELMKSHEWCTPAAKALRERKKQRNMADLEQLIECFVEE